ncbi:hypothetical protein LUU34_00744600 [Aix galericulata]|nr:hypothetical protein LUU34_00744600 [Aix galericulata]
MGSSPPPSASQRGGPLPGGGLAGMLWEGSTAPGQGGRAMAPPCAGALRCALLCAFLCALLCAQGPAATRAARTPPGPPATQPGPWHPWDPAGTGLGPGPPGCEGCGGVHVRGKASRPLPKRSWGWSTKPSSSRPRNGSLTGHRDGATSASPAAPLPSFPPHTCRQEREPTSLGSNVCSCACRDKNN